MLIQIALMGAGGKMGCRLTDNLINHPQKYKMHFVEISEAGIANLAERGLEPTPQDEALQRAEVTLSFPFENIGASLASLFTAVAGNLFELSAFSGLKLLDVQIPSIFAEAYPLPAFGIEGTRRLVSVWDRPIIGTIIKPSVGLSPEQTAELVRDLCEADIDFIKDDELQANSPHSPLSDRVAAVMCVINHHADKTGKQVMYAFNVTGDLDQMRRGHDVVRDHGGTYMYHGQHDFGGPGCCCGTAPP